MNDANEILKKILLNMKYDPKKSLNENRKIIIKESCIPLDTKLTEFQEGGVRSTQYPELGKWKDGTCKCTDNTNCLEFKSECCKTIKVSTDTSGKEIKYVTYFNPLGGALVLPENAKILNWSWEKSVVSGLTPEKFAEEQPGIKRICESTRKDDLINCYSDFQKKWLSVHTSEKGVHSFSIDGKIYSACWKVSNNDGFPKPENVEFFTGYFTSCKPVGEQWISPEQNTEKKSENTKYTVTPETGKEILNKRIKGTNTYVNDPGQSYNNEEGMLFQLGGE